jgi:hypothetical protein
LSHCPSAKTLRPNITGRAKTLLDTFNEELSSLNRTKINTPVPTEYSFDRKSGSIDLGINYPGGRTREPSGFKAKLSNLKYNILGGGLMQQDDFDSYNPYIGGTRGSYYGYNLDKYKGSDKVKMKIADFMKTAGELKENGKVDFSGFRQNDSRYSTIDYSKKESRVFSDSVVSSYSSYDNKNTAVKKGSLVKKEIISLLQPCEQPNGSISSFRREAPLRNNPKVYFNSGKLYNNLELYPDEITSKMKKKFPELMKATQTTRTRVVESEKVNKMKNTIDKILSMKK